MEISREQFALIEPYLPRQRGNVLHQGMDIINAILWLAENDCKWSALPSRYGSWHTVYARVNRWSKSGVLDRVFEQMQRLQLIRLRLEVVQDAASTNAEPATEHAWGQPRYTPSLDLTSELPKFAWVPRVRICHRRLAALRRRATKPRVVDTSPSPDSLPSAAG